MSNEPSTPKPDTSDVGEIRLPPKAAELMRVLDQYDDYFGLLQEVIAEATAQQAQRIAALEAELRKRHSRDCRTRLDSRDVPSNNTVYHCTCGILSLLSESEAKQ